MAKLKLYSIVVAVFLLNPLFVFSSSDEPLPACGRPGMHDGLNTVTMAEAKKVVQFHCRGQQLHGPYEVKSMNGTLLKHGQFWAGELHGKWTRFYDNGVKRDEGSWYRGSPAGQWVGWNRNGTVEFTKNFGNPQKDLASAPGGGVSFQWTKFRAGALYGVQVGSSGNTTSPWIYYVPTATFSPLFEAYFLAGGTVYRSAATQFSVVGNLGLMASFKPLSQVPLWLELGPGIEYSPGDSMISTMARAGFQYRFNKPPQIALFKLEGLVLNYARVMLGFSGDLNIVYAGAQISL